MALHVAGIVSGTPTDGRIAACVPERLQPLTHMQGMVGSFEWVHAPCTALHAPALPCATLLSTCVEGKVVDTPGPLRHVGADVAPQHLHAREAAQRGGCSRGAQPSYSCLLDVC
jgi:hypothetical protein